ncbi:MAG TPA: hypothetical protein VKH63_04555 [Candidatus Acidoferrum sp.]|jgi:hypothetical protein|nr:hypothetical protein [Candidatus Acidoferrum sp.]
MIKKTLRAFSLLCFSLLLTVSALAQCKAPLCQGLQNILDAAVTDFREYRANSAVVSALSTEGAKVPCQMSTWANNVPMYICFAQIPYASGESWYANALASLRFLQPTWQFKIESPVADHFVDAGPPDCSVPATEGPYVGHCPLHLQITRQTDGTAKVYLWVSSLSSFYLVNRPPGPPPKAALAPIATGCDELCLDLKKAFEARASAFEGIRAANPSGGVSEATIKLTGAAECAVNTALRLHSNEPVVQYVCYWTESSASAADARFRDLVARLQVLAPSNWVTQQDDQAEELTGAKVKAWCAVAADNKQEICIYTSGESVGLHIQTRK